MENGHTSKSQTLAEVLDGNEPEDDITHAMDTSGLQDEPLIDGVPASKAFRNREIMLLQAVAEKYKTELGPDVDASVLVRDFLGTSEHADKLTNMNGNVDDRGVLDIDTTVPSESNGEATNHHPISRDNLLERSKYIPLRLTLDERKKLRLCEAALNVSEYTDKVDILIWKSKSGRIHEQIRDICAILSGLAVAANYHAGQELIANRDFKANEKYFQNVFEIGRRHKILNPERMRTDYGKLIHMLMDSQLAEINNLLEFRLVKKVKTVHEFLEERDALDLLKNKEATIATSAISDRGKSRFQVQRDVRAKEKAVKQLINDFSGGFSGGKLTREEVEWCLYSLSDNSAFLYFNRDPIDHMIDYLKADFPEGLSDTDTRSLAIRAGIGGSRLSHGHKRQFQFALQTLTLWREIQNDMFKLWYLAEEDLLNENNYYSLRNTGQGLNRIQSAPRIGKEMYNILHRVQSLIGSWVGSSVVHLGDHNVPNALTFIDKYTQVPRILNPIVNVIDSIPRLARDTNIADMIEKAHGSIKDCQLDILQDFFKHAFDGSGADNFYDAGSCIDGRLTSAWNWCNKLDKKTYYPIFKLAGFNGFDGDFKS